MQKHDICVRFNRSPHATLSHWGPLSYLFLRICCNASVQKRGKPPKIGLKARECFLLRIRYLLFSYIQIYVSYTKSRLSDYDIQLKKPQIIGFIKLFNNKLETGRSVKK